jgi:hypothetical protein
MKVFMQFLSKISMVVAVCGIFFAFSAATYAVDAPQGSKASTSGATTSTDSVGKKAACEGAIAAGVADTCGDSKASKDSFKALIGTVINILSVIVGAVSVIMIIIGGFRYVVSNGDSGALGGAKNTILYAIVGLVIVLFAQVIVAFVIDRATS